MHRCEVKWSRSVVPDSLWPRGLKPASLLCPWNFSGNNTEWVAISTSRRSSWPRDWTQVSCVSWTGRRILYHPATWIHLPLNILHTRPPLPVVPSASGEREVTRSGKIQASPFIIFQRGTRQVKANNFSSWRIRSVMLLLVLVLTYQEYSLLSPRPTLGWEQEMQSG